ncbi:winged helix-turn-helix domain-containing protein [Pseudoalteromonas sp. McH1-42]|uniref:winged helix-turn-helix domain-containing protein n=1 Tax=Pseudoalteromonas sp. McH1-42 TaxID=2917752 RepID=UPI001EF62FDE|nr:winged helix-turn-helix domain-containing protein [Pseudoalteromonas sp. McH1-42]MCG7563980.1 winged helix-turn-helix domain-containing protein [Pseudoalteromonas sp. McH1-42]
METSTRAQHYHFLSWQFDASKDELRAPDSQVAIKLEPQVARLLELFVCAPDQVLSRSTLNEALWPDTIVESNSLYQLLTKLRRVLNDSARQPRFIKTVPKRGYVFIAPVERHQPTSQLNVHTDTEIQRAAGSNPHIRFKKRALMAAIPVVTACFSAIAYFSTVPEPITLPQYEVEDITYELGLEFDVAAHTTLPLLAYVDDFKTLVISDKQGNVTQRLHFDDRVAKPAWHPTKGWLAFWQYQGDGCTLLIVNANGQQLNQSQAIPCYHIQAPSWQSDTLLIATVRTQAGTLPYQYNIDSNKYISIPLKLNDDEKLITTLRGWDNQTYYLIKDASQHSRLVTLDGKVQMRWSYPVWLIAYDPKHHSMITNDNSKHHNLIATTRDGHEYPVIATPQGIFSSLSVDDEGNIFSAAESWQVNIRDKDNLPIFSSSSHDYLPVTNSLGETAFMSRRTGACEIYLHSHDRVIQLTHHKGSDYVNFVTWSPDNAYILANRETRLLLLDRTGVQKTFTPQLSLPLRHFGWLDTDTLWATDGHEVVIYTKSGQFKHRVAIASDLILYDYQTQNWLIFKDSMIYRTADLAGTFEDEMPLTTLKPQAYHQVTNPRLRDGFLYWQSAWSKTDHIWRLALDGKTQPELLKTQNLLWHYDIAADGTLLIAKMESVEGDIKRLSQKPDPN